VLDAAGKAPAAGGAVAAVDRNGLAVRTDRPPGENGARRRENLPRHGGRDIGRGHRAATGLHDAPGGRAVGLGELLDRLHEGCGIDLEAVARAWKQHAQQPRVVQRRQHLGRELALLLAASGVGRKQRAKLPRPRDAIARF
jgi:hypothetical protein